MSKTYKAIAAPVAALLLLLAWGPAAQADMAPQQVANSTFSGIQYIHGGQAAPRMYFGVRPGRLVSSCGPITGSAYCPADNALFITTDHIAFAYRFGDAALAYVIAHEYAHAMQAAFGLMSRRTQITELQADCLAGVYLGSVPNLVFDESDYREIASLAYNLGDYTWGRGHHGTPRQRVSAVVHGLQSAADGAGLQGIRACFG
ncbi:MAG TPA: neutral zinc metallopeptidase [Thermoanaerobaculia bacterium]|nr:neutral zinc metallopeptidase [Thermoanaerobaculia bacterium]